MALLIGLRFALGAGESVIYPAANQFVARWIPMHERGVINGLIFAGVGAGSGLTPPMLNWLITHHGWRAAFWFSAAVGFAAAIVWWLISRDRPEEHPGVDQAELREIRDGMEFHAGAERKGIDWHAIFHRRDLPVLMAGYFSFGYIAWIYFSWFFLYMAQVRQGGSEVECGLCHAAVSVDDGLLPAGRSDERPDDAALGIAGGPMRTGSGVAGGDGGIPGAWDRRYGM